MRLAMSLAAAAALSTPERILPKGSLLVGYATHRSLREDKVGAAFADERVWNCIRDGSVHITEDGLASNTMNAYFMAWERTPEPL